MSHAPVALFAFRRPDHLARVIAGLQANPGARATELFVFCDAARNPPDREAVAAVRTMARAITGFATITVIERAENFGLARSIREGVSALCASHGCVIVLEDDVVPTPYFLPYVNAALIRYADDDRVISIGAYTFDGGHSLPPTFFLNIPDCWGWAVWDRSWKTFEPDGSKLMAGLAAQNRTEIFDFDGAYPYAAMLRDQIAGQNASWAILWYAHAALTGGLTLYPHLSVTSNIGNDGSGTHGGTGASTPGLSTRSAMAPIDVSVIPVEECALARRAWAECLRRQQGGVTERMLYGNRQRLGRLVRAARRSLSRIRTNG
jgi:hypothetical protein